MKRVTEELIEKFLSGRCTKEEAAIVAKYLQENPDEPYLFNEFEEEDGETPLPAGYREEMLAVIESKTGEGRSRMVRSIRRWAVAASILLVLGMGYLLIRDHRSAAPVLVHTATNPAPKQLAWIDQYNAGTTEMVLQLPDGSTVRLASGATIHYREDLGRSEKREIRMDGKVVFEVARAKEQPFIVYSEGLQTKVLGTVFSVMATKGSDRIKVKLLEGKVLVSLDEKVVADAKQDYYLFPGEELVFDKLRRQVAISRAGRKEKDADERTLAGADSLSNWYMFNNQGLAGVFNQLSAIYNVPIEYSKADIQKMYFIGKLEKKDSINKILQDIALLNHLTVTMKDGKYIITKKNP